MRAWIEYRGGYVMNGRFCIWRSPEFRYKLVSVLFPGMILSSSCFGESEIGQAPLGNRQILQSQFQEFRISSSLQYFPHSYFPVQPILIYPGVQWAYPCFPFVSCMELQQYRRYKRREKRQQPKPVFGQGASLVDESMEDWRAGLRPAVEPFRTDEHQIVPALRGHSLIRPEYREAGSILPRFSNGTE
ncbi:MAG: hypothetical protein UZ02_AOB001000108 [Nitrosomonas europaea]|nr:MAG: hypothetical protein UZ02_AOB001000108 [Nitrosomonas europaea]